MITYKHDGLHPFKITVKLEGKNVGYIRRAKDGYFYRPIGGDEGEHFASVEAVKFSIEAS